METHNLLRHQLIKSLMVPPPERPADAAIAVWEQMATQIISIVGEDGFNALFARTLFLNQAAFPWLASSLQAPRTEYRFADLQTSLEAQTPAQASEASSLLLITFTDVLASLIGEQLTTRILRLAWSNNISNKAEKEFKNE